MGLWCAVGSYTIVARSVKIKGERQVVASGGPWGVKMDEIEWVSQGSDHELFSTRRTSSSGIRTRGIPRNTFCCERWGSVPESTPQIRCSERRVATSVDGHALFRESIETIDDIVAHGQHPKRKPCG